MDHLQPTLIVIDIGTNDLALPMCCPLGLAEAVVTVARVCRGGISMTCRRTGSDAAYYKKKKSHKLK